MPGPISRDSYISGRLKMSRSMLGSRSSSNFDQQSNTPQTPGMPQPDNYTILRHVRVGSYLVVEIKYLDCTNYEGKKILVFKGITINDLYKQRLIDPHFSDNKEYYSPVARFEPTEEGWNLAKKLIIYGV